MNLPSCCGCHRRRDTPAAARRRKRSYCGIPYWGLLFIVLLYVTFAIVMEVIGKRISPCFATTTDCLNKGVDNSRSTIVSGGLVTLVSLALAMHLWIRKCCLVHDDDSDGENTEEDVVEEEWADVEHQNATNNDNKKRRTRPSCCHRSRNSRTTNQGTIFSSGVRALLGMGLVSALQTLARILQPDRSTGRPFFWWLWSASYILWWIVNNVFTTQFAYSAVHNRKRSSIITKEQEGRWARWCGSFGDIWSGLGWSKLIMTISAAMVFVAAIICSVVVRQESSSDPSSFVSSGDRWLLRTWNMDDDDVFKLSHPAQRIAQYGEYIFLGANFIFWCFISNRLQRAAHFHESYETNQVMGVSTKIAARLLPWISFFFLLYPVWLWICRLLIKSTRGVGNQITTNTRMEHLDYQGIVYHFGYLLMAVLMHNCVCRLTFQKNLLQSTKRSSVIPKSAMLKSSSTSPQKQSSNRSFPEDLFHDLTFGIFDNDASNPEVKDWEREQKLEQEREQQNQRQMLEEAQEHQRQLQFFGHGQQQVHQRELQMLEQRQQQREYQQRQLHTPGQQQSQPQQRAMYTMQDEQLPSFDNEQQTPQQQRRLQPVDYDQRQYQEAQSQQLEEDDEEDFESVEVSASSVNMQEPILAPAALSQYDLYLAGSSESDLDIKFSSSGESDDQSSHQLQEY